MKAFARIAATILGMNRRGISKHAFNKTTRLKGLRSRCKLKIARGAGTISAKSDILQLCREGKWDQAADMDLEHEHRCGESLFGEVIRAQWRSYAIEEVLTS